MFFLRQSTAGQEVPIGPFLDSTDGNTEETALSIANTDVDIWKEGATALVDKNSGGATHMTKGMYYTTLDATDTNTLGNLRIYVHVSGALYAQLDCIVLSATIYDWLIAGSGTLGVNATQIGGQTASAAGTVTFPGTIASTTNITAGTITTATNLTNLPTIPTNWITAAGITAAALNGKGDWLLSSGYTAPPSVSAIADQVWDEVLSGHLTAGSTGNALNAAGAAGDPWTTGLPGAYGAGSAGYIIGNNLNAAMTSRMASYTQPTGFLAATFPTTVASTTNITGGTITTTTNLTNLPTMPTDWLTSAGLSAGAVTEIQSGLATAAALTTIDDFLDTEVAAILAAVDTEVGAIKTKTDQLTFTVANQVDANALTGGGGMDAAATRAALGLASANLDTQLTGINTNINGLQGATLIKNAVNVVQFQMKLSSDHYSAATGKTVTAKRSLGTGSYSAATGSVSEVGSGTYAFTTSAADCNADSGSFIFENVDCDSTVVQWLASA